MSSTEVPAAAEGERVNRKITMDTGAVHSGWLDAAEAILLDTAFKNNTPRTIKITLYTEQEGGTVSQVVTLKVSAIESIEEL